MTAFTTPVSSTFQRAAHLIDAGYIHSETGNLFKSDVECVYSSDAPFDTVIIIHRATGKFEIGNICW